VGGRPPAASPANPSGDLGSQRLAEKLTRGGRTLGSELGGRGETNGAVYTGACRTRFNPESGAAWESLAVHR